MKIKKGFVLRSVSGENVVIAIGRATLDLNGIIRLNETGTLLWNKLADGGAELEDLVKLLVDTYGIDESIAKNDANAFITSLKTANCLE